MPKCQKCGKNLAEKDLKKYRTFYFKIPVTLRLCKECLKKEEINFNKQLKLLTIFVLTSKVLLLVVLIALIFYAIYLLILH